MLTKPFLEKLCGHLCFKGFERMAAVEGTAPPWESILFCALVCCLFVVKAGLKFTMELRMTLKFGSSSLYLLRAGVIGMEDPRPHWVYVVLGENPRLHEFWASALSTEHTPCLPQCFVVGGSISSFSLPPILEDKNICIFLLPCS